MKKQTNNILIISTIGVGAFLLGYYAGYGFLDYWYTHEAIQVVDIYNSLISNNVELILNLLLIFPFALTIVIWTLIFYHNRGYKYLGT